MSHAYNRFASCVVATLVCCRVLSAQDVVFPATARDSLTPAASQVSYISAKMPAQTGWKLPEAVELSGFGDLLFHQIQESGNTGRLGLGQLEVDLEADLGRGIVVTTALAYDEPSRSAGLGQLTVDFRLLGREGQNLIHSKSIRGAGLVVGRFDVPFGLDWMVYPSVDRLTVTAPLAVEGVHEFWNDYGAYGYLNHDRFNLTLFATDGSVLGGDRTGFAAGGRLGIMAGERLEIGTSAAEFFSRAGGPGMSVWGADIQATLRELTIRGEYLSRSGYQGERSSGYYLQGLYGLGKYYVVCRAGQFDSRNDNDPKLTRFTAGTGCHFTGGFRLSVEQQVGHGLKEMTLVQLVYGF